MQRIGFSSAPAPAEAAGLGGLSAPDVLAFVERAAATLVRHEALLDRLDAALGDGDHGSNMVAGFSAAVPVARAALVEHPDDVGELLRRLGHTLVGSVGGASGPLYGTALIEAGFALAGQATAGPADLATALEAARAGLIRRGRCAVGDKTILDALDPAVRALRAGADASAPARRLRCRCCGRRRGRDAGDDPPRRAARPGASPRRAIAGAPRPRRDVVLPDAPRDGPRHRRGPRPVNERDVDRQAALEARVRELEAERRRVFEDAQREADAVFAQYQLSQLLAAGGRVDELAAAVLAEVARASGAAGAALWLADPGGSPARAGRHLPGRPGGSGRSRLGRRPEPVRGHPAAARWAAAGGWSGISLPEGRAVGGEEPGAAPGGRSGTWPSAPMPGRPSSPTMPATSRRSASSWRSRCARPSFGPRSRASRRPWRRFSTGRPTPSWPSTQDGASCASTLPRRSSSGRRRRPGRGCAARTSSAATRRRADLRDALDEPRLPRTAGLLCGTRCPFEEVLGTGDVIVGREIGVRHRDGTTIPVAASVSRMPVPDGGAVGVLRDLRASRSLDEAKTSFVAAVSHELRTPLALIDGYTQSLLHLDPDAATARRHLDGSRTPRSGSWPSSTTSST